MPLSGKQTWPKFIPVGIKWGRYNIILCTCYHSVGHWFHRQCYSSRATRLIGGLVVSHSTVSRVVVGLMITYLATNWRHPHFGLAAVVANVQDGVSDILVVVLAHISDTSVGHFRMIVFTNIAYFLGLVLLAVSAGFMSQDIAAGVFYGAAVLIALGEAGRSASLEEFHEDQCISERTQKPYISDDEKTWTAEALWHQWWVLGAVLAVFLSGFEWYLIFMISASAIGFFLFIFWLGRASYFINNKDLASNKKAIRILHLDYLENISTLCPVEQLQEPRRELYTATEMIPYRRAEQAQEGENLTEPEESLRPAERVRAKKFWTLSKLKEEKLSFMKLLPWCPAFLVYSAVEASVNTFYIEQTDNWKVPAAGIILIMNSKSFSNFIIPYLFQLLVPKKCRDDTVMQIGCGLTCCVFCCIAAWQVEIHRMSSVKHGSNIISVFWLLPQFCLAGFMEGLAVGGLNGLVLDQVAEDNKLLTRYGPHIIDFVLGIGKLITALILLACRQSWFQGDMKTSRLDKYYRFLTKSC